MEEQPFDTLINSYLETNVGMDTAFLTDALSQGLRQNILQLQHDGLMTAAGIGNATVKDAGQTMRGDTIYWLDKAHGNFFESAFLLRVEAFISYLNRTCYAGINGYEFHYAIYEPGGFYKRHRDQFKTDTGRVY